MKKRVLTITFLVFIICNIALATAQESDVIIYKNQKYRLLTNPMEFYYKKNQSIKKPDFTKISSANWRGYVAKWVIVDRKLFLTNIYAEINNRPAKIRDFFPNVKSNKVFAHWFTGYLVIPIGEVKKYIHMGYGSLYSKYMLIKVIRGEEKGSIEYTKDEYLKMRQKQFEKYRETDEYKHEVEEAKKQDGNKFNQKEFDEFLFVFEINYSSIIVN